MKQPRISQRPRTTRRSRRSEFLGASLGVIVTVLTGCAAPSSSEPTAESVVVAFDGAQFGSLIPGRVNQEGDFRAQALYDTVLSAGANPVNAGIEVFEPWLATDWTLSDDRHELTLTIREDVTFSDGEPLDARAIEANFDAFFADTSSYQHALAVGYGVEVEAIDDRTLVYRADVPLGAYNTKWLATTPIASPAALADPEGIAVSPVGSGPYVLDEDSTVDGVEYRFERRDEYWNAEAFPYDSVTVRGFSDRVAALNALMSGEVDVTIVDVASVATAEEAGFEIETGYGRYRALVLGAHGDESTPIGDLRVRQAINLAFDRVAIDENLDFGLGRATSQLFDPAQDAYVQGGDERYAYDLDRARELMAEAGYPDGFDLVLPTSVPFADMEPIVQQSLGDIGIRVTFDNYPDLAALVPEVNAGKYPIIMLNAYFVGIRQNLLDPGSTFGPAWPRDSTLDALLADIDNGEPDEAAAAWQELGQLALDEAWFAPFSNLPGTWAHTPDVDLALTNLIAFPSLRGIRPVS